MNITPSNIKKIPIPLLSEIVSEKNSQPITAVITKPRLVIGYRKLRSYCDSRYIHREREAISIVAPRKIYRLETTDRNSGNSGWLKSNNFTPLFMNTCADEFSTTCSNIRKKFKYLICWISL
jgi:hypothetical protein